MDEATSSFTTDISLAKASILMGAPFHLRCTERHNVHLYYDLKALKSIPIIQIDTKLRTPNLLRRASSLRGKQLLKSSPSLRKINSDVGGRYSPTSSGGGRGLELKRKASDMKEEDWDVRSPIRQKTMSQPVEASSLVEPRKPFQNTIQDYRVASFASEAVQRPNSDSVLKKDVPSALLERSSSGIGKVAKPDHQPKQSASKFYNPSREVQALLKQTSTSLSEYFSPHGRSALPPTLESVLPSEKNVNEVLVDPLRIEVSMQELKERSDADKDAAHLFLKSGKTAVEESLLPQSDRSKLGSKRKSDARTETSEDGSQLMGMATEEVSPPKTTKPAAEGLEVEKEFSQRQGDAIRQRSIRSSSSTKMTAMDTTASIPPKTLTLTSNSKSQPPSKRVLSARPSSLPLDTTGIIDITSQLPPKTLDISSLPSDLASPPPAGSSLLGVKRRTLGMRRRSTATSASTAASTISRASSPPVKGPAIEESLAVKKSTKIKELLTSLRRNGSKQEMPVDQVRQRSITKDVEPSLVKDAATEDSSASLRRDGSAETVSLPPRSVYKLRQRSFKKAVEPSGLKNASTENPPASLRRNSSRDIVNVHKANSQPPIPTETVSLSPKKSVDGRNEGSIDMAKLLLSVGDMEGPLKSLKEYPSEKTIPTFASHRMNRTSTLETHGSTVGGDRPAKHGIASNETVTQALSSTSERYMKQISKDPGIFDDGEVVFSNMEGVEPVEDPDEGLGLSMLQTLPITTTGADADELPEDHDRIPIVQNRDAFHEASQVHAIKFRKKSPQLELASQPSLRIDDDGSIPSSPGLLPTSSNLSQRHLDSIKPHTPSSDPVRPTLSVDDRVPSLLPIPSASSSALPSTVSPLRPAPAHPESPMGFVDPKVFMTPGITSTLSAMTVENEPDDKGEKGSENDAESVDSWKFGACFGGFKMPKPLKPAAVQDTGSQSESQSQAAGTLPKSTINKRPQRKSACSVKDMYDFFGSDEEDDFLDNSRGSPSEASKKSFGVVDREVSAGVPLNLPAWTPAPNRGLMSTLLGSASRSGPKPSLTSNKDPFEMDDREKEESHLLDEISQFVDEDVNVMKRLGLH
ncbi:hypothetical protein BC829DRAFT_439606 [Chytridium lagenaria]|nr:hypothetical protein BC829DRAFT_439606 [Chytridium lagenaria]